MLVGVPSEVKNREYRVAITPAGVHELSTHGHEVYVEADAGLGSSITDAEFVAAGAKILPTADDVWQTGELILRGGVQDREVNRPVAVDYPVAEAYRVSPRNPGVRCLDLVGDRRSGLTEHREIPQERLASKLVRHDEQDVLHSAVGARLQCG